MAIAPKDSFNMRILGLSKSEAEDIYKLRFNESDLHFFQIPSHPRSKVILTG